MQNTAAVPSDQFTDLLGRLPADLDLDRLALETSGANEKSATERACYGSRRPRTEWVFVAPDRNVVPCPYLTMSLWRLMTAWSLVRALSGAPVRSTLPDGFGEENLRGRIEPRKVWDNPRSAAPGRDRQRRDLIGGIGRGRLADPEQFERVQHISPFDFSEPQRPRRIRPDAGRNTYIRI